MIMANKLYILSLSTLTCNDLLNNLNYRMNHNIVLLGKYDESDG